MANTTSSMGAVIRSELWSNELKEVLLDELIAQQWVDWMNEFPDGDQFTIPSIGQFTADDYTENEDVLYQALDTGEFNFAITEYLSSGTYITKKAMQDSFYMSQIMASFVPKQHRAIMKRLETDILRVGPEAQTTADYNSINGAAHRWAGSGTSEHIGAVDFAKAKFALDKANIPDQARIAIVDPSVEYDLNGLTGIVDVTYNPKWEGVIESGLAKSMRFVRNIYGFDVFVSNNLLKSTASETVGGDAVAAAAAANLFFSVDSSVLPIKGAWRQMPEVDGEYNKDRQREEFVTTARYGVKLYRPENMCVCLTETGVTF